MLPRLATTSARFSVICGSPCARPGLSILLTITCLSLAPNASLAEKPAEPSTSSSPTSTPSPEDIAHWIKDLSSDAFSLRQEAGARLLAAGAVARQPLIDLANGTDPETRAAARRLVALIDRSEFRRRLDAFAADTDGRQGLTLPGWPEYQKLIGNDAQARALFVDMQRQEGPLIAAMFGTNKHGVEELFETRLVRIAQWQQIPSADRGNVPPIGSCAAMLFLASNPNITVTDAAASFVETILQRPPVNTALLPDSAQPALKKLVVTWLTQCPNKNEGMLQRRLSIISSMGLIDALPLALRVCGNDPQFFQISALTKAMAAMTVGQLGNRSNVAQLEPLLENTEVCVNNAVQIPGQALTTVQVRDVALVMILALTDQSPADYGYTAARLNSPRNYQIQTLYRENDQQRTESIAKWREWKSAHKAELTSNKNAAPAAAAPTLAKPGLGPDGTVQP